MNNKFFPNGLVLVAGLAVLLSACGDSGRAGGSGAGDVVDAVEAVDNVAAIDSVEAVDTPDSTADTQLAAAAPLDDSDFSFPPVTDTNGSISVAPAGPVPVFSARRTLAAGAGETIEFGDPVVLRYSMYAWSTGVLVESSDDFDDAITIRAGITGNSPEYLSNSLLGRRIGDRLQVVLKAGTDDLPGGFDANDAYIVVADLL